MASQNASPKRIAILGAGISGLTLASEIKACSPQTEITVFEKSRGLAGRMATRRADPFALARASPAGRRQSLAARGGDRPVR